MMFKGEDHQALQNLTENGNIIPNDQKTPIKVLDAIQTTIKEEENFWHYRDETQQDFQQKPDEGMHSLSNQITTLITNSILTHTETKEALKIVLL